MGKFVDWYKFQQTAAIVGVTVAGCLVSYLLGAHEGTKRFISEFDEIKVSKVAEEIQQQ